MLDTSEAIACGKRRLPMPRPGQVLGLVGTNGIGKSTAIKVLAGKLKPNLGRFTVSARGFSVLFWGLARCQPCFWPLYDTLYLPHTSDLTSSLLIDCKAVGYQFGHHLPQLRRRKVAVLEHRCWG